jgi:small subunit ribosomal protein S6
MSDAKPIYDLMLLLDPAAADEQKAKILSDSEAAIAKAGEVVGKHDYGLRQMTFEIQKKKEAEYHLIQFHGTPELLEALNRTLRITDGILRFRLIKLAPGTPPPPDLTARAQSEAAASAPDDFEDDDERSNRSEHVVPAT